MLLFLDPLFFFQKSVDNMHYICAWVTATWCMKLKKWPSVEKIILTINGDICRIQQHILCSKMVQVCYEASTKSNTTNMKETVVRCLVHFFHIMVVHIWSSHYKLFLKTWTLDRVVSFPFSKRSNSVISHDCDFS